MFFYLKFSTCHVGWRFPLYLCSQENPPRPTRPANRSAPFRHKSALLPPSHLHIMDTSNDDDQQRKPFAKRPPNNDDDQRKPPAKKPPAKTPAKPSRVAALLESDSSISLVAIHFVDPFRSCHSFSLHSTNDTSCDLITSTPTPGGQEKVQFCATGRCSVYRHLETRVKIYQ
jgi:hypothetical protein